MSMVDDKVVDGGGLKVVIIGAGVAGLSAANELIKRGFTNVIILEGQDRIGGRVNTIKHGNAFVELGAQWIHGEVGNPIHEIAFEHNCLTDSISDPITALDSEFRTQYGELLNRHLARDFEIIMSSIMEECREIATSTPSGSEQNLTSSKIDKSALGFFQKKFNEYLKSTTDLPKASLIKDGLFNWYCLFRNTIEGCDTLAEMSIKSWGDYKECEGNPVIDVRNGYSSIVDVLASTIPKESIFLRKPVKAVHVAKPVDGKLPEGKLPVSIVCHDGENIQCHHVIATVSLGYLKRYANTFIYPALTENKKQAIMSMGFGTVNKIYLEFEKPFWPKNSAGYSFLWLDEPDQDVKGPALKLTIADIWQKAIVGFYTVNSQPNMLCGWIAGREARFMETLDESEVMETCVQLLQQFTNINKLPKVLKIIRTTWNTHPYTFGSYSYKTYQCDEMGDVIGELCSPTTIVLEDHAVGGMRTHPAVLYAGEATHPQYYSTVHGALLSGVREAERLVTYYKAYYEEIEEEIAAKRLYKTVTSSHRVIIVGGGIAGLAAAVALLDSGIADFKILEAQLHAGGRIESLKLGSNYLEYGAQWIHGQENNPIYELAAKHNLASKDAVPHPEGEGSFYTQDGQQVDINIVREVKAVIGQAFVDCDEFVKMDHDRESIPVSVGDFVSQEFESYLLECNDPPEVCYLKRGIYNWHMTYSCIDNACFNMNELSARMWGEYETCVGNPRVNLKSGYSNVVDFLLQQLHLNNISYGSVVKKIYWDRGIISKPLIRSFEPRITPLVLVDKPKRRGGTSILEVSSAELLFIDDPTSNRSILGLKKSGRPPTTYPVELFCENGNCYLCEHVILTQSVGCMQATMETLFSPPLPQWKMRAFTATGYATINKIFLEFFEPFWLPDCDGYQFVWTDDELPGDHSELLRVNDPWYKDITGFDVLRGFKNVLMGWIGRKGAEEMEKYTPEHVGAVCIALLECFTGIKGISQPVSVHRTAWHSNPYIRGAYCYRTVVNEQENYTWKELAETVALTVDDIEYPILLFAGEATDPCYYSTVHGAYTSGQRAVTEFRQFHRNFHKASDDRIRQQHENEVSEREIQALKEIESRLKSKSSREHKTSKEGKAKRK